MTGKNGKPKVLYFCVQHISDVCYVALPEQSYLSSPIKRAAGAGFISSEHSSKGDIEDNSSSYVSAQSSVAI